MVDIIIPRPDGTARVQEVYSPEFTVDREELGPVQLKSKENSSRSETRDVTVTQSLTLDAPIWAADAHISFHTEMSTASKSTNFEMSCRIGQVVEADTVHASLKGNAWPLDCDYEKGSKRNGYYIEELRYFLVTHSESEFGMADFIIKSIEVER